MTPTQTLRAIAAQQLDAFTADYGAPDDRDAAIDRWMRHLVGTCQVPDEILEAMPEVSRHNYPQDTPQEYECGCVTMTRITDRNSCSWLGRLEEPFEMRLALPCDGTACELSHLRQGPRRPRFDTRLLASSLSRALRTKLPAASVEK